MSKEMYQFNAVYGECLALLENAPAHGIKTTMQNKGEATEILELSSETFSNDFKLKLMFKLKELQIIGLSMGVDLERLSSLESDE